MPNKSFYIIDGHAQIYRAYFAPFRELLSPTGEPTKATYVFTQMLMNLIDQRKPDYLAMVIDSGDESVFRKEIFPEYKATRESPPDDFFPQEKRILQIVKDVGIPISSGPVLRPTISLPPSPNGYVKRITRYSWFPRTRICAKSSRRASICTTRP